MNFDSLEEKDKLMDNFFNQDGTIIEEAPVTDLLDEMKSFMKKYGASLGELREALSDTVSEAWYTENKIINLDMKPKDNTAITSMIKTDNVQFNKIATVFSVLCSEMNYLCEQAHHKFFGPLTMFGHDIHQNDNNNDDDDDDISSSDDDDDDSDDLNTHNIDQNKKIIFK